MENLKEELEPSDWDYDTQGIWFPDSTKAFIKRSNEFKKKTGKTLMDWALSMEGTKIIAEINNLKHTIGLQKDLIEQLKEKLARTEALVQSMSRELSNGKN